MQTILELLRNLTNPEWIMLHGGLYIVMMIVFAETGLLVGFFLPGDSLLFITGMIIANTLSPFSVPLLNLLYWITLIVSAGVTGNFLGYWFGKKFGGRLHHTRDRWYFKRKHLDDARLFYEKKGGAAIVIARFLPIIRTFVPIIGGVVGMNLRKFSFYNIVGCIAWVGLLVSIGFALGENVWVKENLEKIIIGILVVTGAPVALKMLKPKKKALAAAAPLTEVSEEV
jgi:membrane-associated protein